MSAADWSDLEVLYAKAMAAPENERAAVLASLCAEQPTLRHELASLIGYDEQADDYFDRLAASLPTLGLPAGVRGFPSVDLEGQTISHYLVGPRLGAGGMGVVYRAEDLRLRREVALKFLPAGLAGDETARQRFLNEARAASALDHPNICTVYEVDEYDGGLFIAMACYPGRTLRDRIAEGPLSMPDALHLIGQVLDGLARAHGRGIVHRDIKPSNLIVTDEGLVKILDFGLAKLMGGTQLTRQGATLGTVAYMAPEQARGGDVDARTDVWAVGVVLYEMLTGQRPFRGGMDAALLYAIAHEPHEPASALVPGLPPALDAALERCLAKEPAHRYATAGALRDALAPFLSHGSQHQPTATLRPMTFQRLSAAPRVRRKPILLGLAAAMLLVLAALAGARWGGLLGGTAAETHLAILPLTVVGGGDSDAVLAHGLRQTLTSKVSQLERYNQALWVIPTDAIAETDAVSLVDAREALDVTLVVSGSLQADGGDGSRRLTLNLIDARTMRQLASTVIDSRGDDATAMQDQAALALARMLDVQLLPDQQARLTAGGTSVAAANELYLQGRGYLQNTNDETSADRALRMFEQAVALDPSFASAHAGIADAYMLRYLTARSPDDLRRALDAAKEAVRLGPQDAAAQVSQAKILLGLKQHDAAHRALDIAETLAPHDLDVIEQRARLLQDEGKVAEAEAGFRELVAMRPYHWKSYNTLGSFLLSQGRFDEAREQYRQALVYMPDDARVYSNIAVTFFYQKQWRESTEMFERALRLEPENARTIRNLSTAHFYAGNYARAAELYGTTAEMEPDNYAAWGYLADALHFAGAPKAEVDAARRRAVALLEELVALTPTDTGILDQLAGYYWLLGDRTRGTAMLARSERLPASDGATFFGRGTVLTQMGLADRALPYFQRAFEAGYSTTEAETSPWLAELREDPRFQQLLAEFSQTNR